MQWELVIAVIILIGILAAVKEAWEKRAAHTKETRTKQGVTKKTR